MYSFSEADDTKSDFHVVNAIVEGGFFLKEKLSQIKVKFDP
jgi:hypothetical protein